MISDSMNMHKHISIRIQKQLTHLLMIQIKDCKLALTKMISKGLLAGISYLIILKHVSTGSQSSIRSILVTLELRIFYHICQRLIIFITGFRNLEKCHKLTESTAREDFQMLKQTCRSHLASVKVTFMFKLSIISKLMAQ